MQWLFLVLAVNMDAYSVPGVVVNAPIEVHEYSFSRRNGMCLLKTIPKIPNGLNGVWLNII